MTEDILNIKRFETLIRMSNEDLIMVYKYSMLIEYLSISKFTKQSYHPVYEHNAVTVNYECSKKRSLYTPHLISILNEMYYRMCSGNFKDMAFWISTKLLSTKIQYHFEVSNEANNMRTGGSNINLENYIVYEGEKYFFLSSGYSRNVYSSKCGNFVIKVPREDNFDSGVSQNNLEALLYSDNKDSGLYAECFLLENGWLLMERVEESMTNDLFEEFPIFKTMGYIQIGRAKNGRVVAFDYGSNK